jgi:hypothetical protein
LLILEAFSKLENWEQAHSLLKEKEKSFNSFDLEFCKSRYESIMKENAISTIRELEVNRLKFILQQLKHIENRIPEEKSNQSFTKNLQEFLNSFSFPEKKEKEIPVIVINKAESEVVEEDKMIIEQETPKKEKKKKEKVEPKQIKKTKSPKTKKLKLTTSPAPPSAIVETEVVPITLTETPLTPKTETQEKQKVKTKSTPILKDTRESQPIEVSKNILTELIEKKELIPELIPPEPSKKRKRENEKSTPQKKKKEKIEQPAIIVEPEMVEEMVEEPIVEEEIKKTPRQRGRKKKEKGEQVEDVVIQEVPPSPVVNSSAPVTPTSDEKKKRGRKKKIETTPPPSTLVTIPKKSSSPVEKKEILSDEQLKEIHILLSETFSKLEENIDLMEIFLYPVSNEVAEFYDQIIKYPMNLSEIKSFIEKKKFSSISELKQKLWLMFANALIYNPPTHHVHKITIKVKNDVEKVMNEAKVKESKILNK